MERDGNQQSFPWNSSAFASLPFSYSSKMDTVIHRSRGDMIFAEHNNARQYDKGFLRLEYVVNDYLHVMKMFERTCLLTSWFLNLSQLLISNLAIHLEQTITPTLHDIKTKVSIEVKVFCIIHLMRFRKIKYGQEFWQYHALRNNFIEDSTLDLFIIDIFNFQMQWNNKLL